MENYKTLEKRVKTAGLMAGLLSMGFNEGNNYPGSLNTGPRKTTIANNFPKDKNTKKRRAKNKSAAKSRKRNNS